MAMCTTFVRDKKPISLRWGYWHLNRFLEAFELETGRNDASWFTMDAYTFKGFHEFTDETDGEVLTILPGDSIHVWRDR